MPSTLPDPQPQQPGGPGFPGGLGLPGGPHGGLGSAMMRLRHRWGWFVALGALTEVLGVLALGLVVFSTLTAVFIIAIFMIIKGGSEITVGLNAKSWGREILLILAGLAYIVAGAFAFAQPGPTAAVLTLVLGIALVVAGATRVWVGAHMASHARTMVIVSGVVTALVGLLIVFGWPGNTLYILGTLLGVDLVVTGFMWIGFGLRLRSHA